MLRCVWQTEPDHPSQTELQHLAAGDLEVLVCAGCSATFLVKNGIPVMLREDALEADEKKDLRRARKVLLGR
jgi:uncharacterized protein YbaR (Trm112 family)